MEAVQKEHLESLFNLKDDSLRSKIAFVLYADNILCEALTTYSPKKPGLTVKLVSLTFNVPEWKARYHLDRLVTDGLAEKYAGIYGKRAVGFYKPSGRFVKTMKSMGVNEGVHEAYRETDETLGTL